MDYVHQKMDNWFHRAERYLCEPKIVGISEIADRPWPGFGREKNSITTIVPRHFYGEITLMRKDVNYYAKKVILKCFATLSRRMA